MTVSRFDVQNAAFSIRYAALLGFAQIDYFAFKLSPMRETKLYQHLSLLNEPMRKRFRAYLASPYHNPLPRFVDLLDILDQHLLRYKLRQLSEEQAWALYFPGLPFDLNKFRKDCTALLRLLTDFIAQEAYTNDRPQQALYLLQQLNRLGAHHYFHGYAQEAKQILSEANASGKAVFDKVAGIGLEEYRNDLEQPERNSDVGLHDLIAAVEIDYCIRKMELRYVEINHFLVTGKGRPSLDNAFLDLVNARLDDLPVQTRMFYHLHECTRDESAEAHYHAFRTLLKTVGPSENLADMYSAALNFCARRLNAGFAEYLRETHLLHREMLELGLMGQEHRYLSPNFKNAIVVACRLDEYAWAKELLARFSEPLSLPQNQNAHQFAEGVIAYHEGNLKKAEPFFHRLLDEFEDIFYALDARGYLLRIHYESQNQIGLEALLESYRMYIRRHPTLSGTRKAGHNEFIRFMRRLTRVNPHDQDAIARLEQEIQNGRRIPATAWLLKKVRELKREP